MKRIWKRFNHKIRNKVYLRVLPIVAVSVLLVGALASKLFTHHAVNQELKNTEFAVENVLDKIYLKALKTIYAQSGDLNGAGEWDSQSPILVAVELGKESRLSSGSVKPIFGPDCSAEALLDLLNDWEKRHGHFLAQGMPLSTWPGVRNLADPHLADSTPQGDVYFFPPLVTRGMGSKPAQSVLPILMRSKNHRRPEHQLYLVDYSALISQENFCNWWSLVDAQGVLVWSSLPEVEIGSTWETPANLQGKVLSQESPELGLRLLSNNDLQTVRSATRSFWGGMGVLVLVALAGTIWGIAGVANRVSSQMADLAQNMERLAKGDYDGRKLPVEKNEIGILVGYFNLMAVSLDEAHHQVKEKATHLQAALENMRLLDKAKDNFLVLISHEVRTPLTAIMGGVDYLRKSVEQVEGSEREVLDRLNVDEIAGIIQSSGERLSGFMNDAIQMTSIGTSESLLRLNPVPVGELVDQALCGVTEIARSKKIEILNQLGNSSPWTVICDPGVMQTGFAKILHNAVVHNRQHGVVIVREALQVPGLGSAQELVSASALQKLEDQPAFEAFADETLVWRLLEVFNTGAPIPEERRKALFGKFELVEPIEHHQKGTGLSLPIAKAAFESHGGRIFLHSDNRDGNSFFLLVPSVELPQSAAKELLNRNEFGQSVMGTAWNEEVGEVADATPFEIELDDHCATILGGIDEAGGGIDSSSSTDHKEKVTVSSHLK